MYADPATIMYIEGETVTAATGPRLIDTTAYMSVKGASPEPANRLIPLLPSDELTAKAAEIAAVNLLSGEYQLNHNDNADKGHVFYDAQTMRVLGVNGAGEVGFYKLKDTDGKPSELAANRAYINLGGTATRAASIRIVDADCSGVEEIAVDGDLNNADNACYDLYGRPVSHMVPGNIYISKGRKIIAR